MKQMSFFTGLTDNDMLDLLNPFGYDTESFQDCPNLVRDFASYVGHPRDDEGLFYDNRV